MARDHDGNGTARAQKRARILEGAAELIARFGLGKTTIEDIAKKAGLKPASVYYYFKNKEDVFAAVVRHYAETYGDSVREAVAEAETAEAKLVAFLLARFRYLDLVGQVAEPEAMEAYPAVERTLQEYRVQEQKLVEEIIDFGVERGEFDLADPKSFARALSGLLTTVDRSFVMAGLPAPGEDLRTVLEVFLRGLRKR